MKIQGEDVTDRMMRLMAVGIFTLLERRGSMPSGHLYAVLMSEIDIHGYNALVEAGKRLNVWTLENHVLTLEDKGFALASNLAKQIVPEVS